jgi:hypothetical protein
VVQAFHQKHLTKYVPVLRNYLQMGHSRETAETHYARSNEDLPDFSDAKTLEFRNISIVHQHFLHLSVRIKSPYEDMLITPRNMPAVNRPRTDLIDVESFTSRSSVSLDEVPGIDEVSVDVELDIGKCT